MKMTDPEEAEYYRELREKVTLPWLKTDEGQEWLRTAALAELNTRIAAGWDVDDPDEGLVHNFIESHMRGYGDPVVLPREVCAAIEKIVAYLGDEERDYEAQLEEMGDMPDNHIWRQIITLKEWYRLMEREQKA